MGFLDSKIKTYENGMQVLEMDNSVNFLLYIRQTNELVLAKQWRACDGVENINLFGGYLDEGEGYYDALRREMLEETNIDVDSYMVEMIHNVYLDKKVSSGTTTERNSLFIVVLNDSEALRNTMKCNDAKEGITFLFQSRYSESYPYIFSLDGVRGTFALTALEMLIDAGVII